MDWDTGCWVWTGPVDGDGYARQGASGAKKPSRLVHRQTYEHFRGPIPDGITLDHLCLNTICCWPWHMEPVTNEENVRRMNKRRKLARVLR